MQGYKGYYSLIQYCPDIGRLEAANVGVVLFCPERGFLEARVAQGNDRVARFFGRDSFNAERLNAAKRAIVSRLQIEQERFRTLEDLTAFIATRGNDILLSAPRSMKVTAPAQDLDQLFDELVGGRQAKEPRPKSRLFRQLRDIFEKPALKDKILRDEVVIVPVTGDVLEAPYAFHNGVFNLVCPLTFTPQTPNKANKLAIDGNLIQRHGTEGEKTAKLIVALAAPHSEEAAKERKVVEDLFGEYAIDTYREEALNQLESYVEASAH